MTLKSGNGQACAACKYQRRRCTPECLLAPYFPADQPKMFQNAHKLFGVNNIKKILKHLDPDQKVVATKTIKYESNMRERYPVYGCLVEIQQLTYQIQVVEEELQAVQSQLAYFRQQHQLQEMSHNTHNTPLCPAVTALPVTLTAPCSGNIYDYNTNYLNSKENNGVSSLWLQQPHSNSNNNNTNSIAIQSQLTTSQPLSVQQETAQDYDEIHHLFNSIDDRQSYIDSKEAYESSLESSVKDSRQVVEQMAENELKSAAACFSLTSVN